MTSPLTPLPKRGENMQYELNAKYFTGFTPPPLGGGGWVERSVVELYMYIIHIIFIHYLNNQICFASDIFY
jgi:hypothetical protein